jgi:hypothetical protein
MAFTLLSGTDKLIRMQHLIALAELEPLREPEDREMGLALAPFLEVGSSVVCEQTKNIYFDAACYLDRYGYYQEASALASVEVSHWINFFAGAPNDSYFRATARNAAVRHFLEALDRKVKDNGALAESTEDRIQSIADRFGKRSLYVSAWLMSLYSLAEDDEPFLVRN